MIKVDALAGPKLTPLYQLRCDRCDRRLTDWLSKTKFEKTLHEVHETQSGRHYCRQCVNELIREKR